MKRSTAYRVSLVAMAAVLLFVTMIPAAASSESFSIDFSKYEFDAYCGSEPPYVEDVPVAVSRVTYVERACSKFQFPIQYNSLRKNLSFLISDFSMISGETYNLTFSFAQTFNVPCSLTSVLAFVNPSDYSEYTSLVLFNNGNFQSGYLWVDFSSQFRTPEISGSYVCILYLFISSVGGTSVAPQSFYLTDFHFSIDSPLYGDHYENDTSEIDDLNGRIEAVEGQLPSMEDVPLDELFGDVSIDDYNNAFVAVNDIFDNVVSVTGIGSVILFCLAIGLCTYLLGRRLRG